MGHGMDRQRDGHMGARRTNEQDPERRAHRANNAERQRGQPEEEVLCGSCPRSLEESQLGQAAAPRPLREHH